VRGFSPSRTAMWLGGIDVCATHRRCPPVPGGWLYGSRRGTGRPGGRWLRVEAALVRHDPATAGWPPAPRSVRASPCTSCCRRTGRPRDPTRIRRRPPRLPRAGVAGGTHGIRVVHRVVRSRSPVPASRSCSGRLHFLLDASQRPDRGRSGAGVSRGRQGVSREPGAHETQLLGIRLVHARPDRPTRTHGSRSGTWYDEKVPATRPRGRSR